jgi:hypothetical protein
MSEPTDPIAPVIDKLIAYKKTSSEEAHRLHERRRHKEAYGRSCEAATLAVCISELEALANALLGRPAEWPQDAKRRRTRIGCKWC